MSLLFSIKNSLLFNIVLEVLTTAKKKKKKKSIRQEKEIKGIHI